MFTLPATKNGFAVETTAQFKIQDLTPSFFHYGLG